uniref:Uncharacterized protein n=1 Tax=Meloidogyne incognita TaxID=6306 RepID=A0A914P0K1_MELIC
MTPKSARLNDSEQSYDQLNLRWKNCFCAATEGRPGMVFATRWPCFAAVVLASLAATVAKRRPSFRSTCPASSAAAKTFF